MSREFQFYEDPWPFKTIEEKRGYEFAQAIEGASLRAPEPCYTITDKGRAMLGDRK